MPKFRPDTFRKIDFQDHISAIHNSSESENSNKLYFAEISTSICIGLLVWYGGFKNISGETIFTATAQLPISYVPQPNTSVTILHNDLQFINSRPAIDTLAATMRRLGSTDFGDEEIGADDVR